MAIAGPFDRPIPGQSLTTEPKNMPWEDPPQMDDVADVARYYIERVAKPEVLDDFAAMCQAGAALAPIVESTYLQGVMRGLHTLDAGIIVAPMLHQFLKAALTEMGVDVIDTDDDPEERAKEAEINRFLLLANKYLDEEGMDEEDPGKQMLQEMVDAGEQKPSDMGEPTEEPSPMNNTQEAKPMGLMAKG